MSLKPAIFYIVHESQPQRVPTNVLTWILNKKFILKREMGRVKGTHAGGNPDKALGN